MVERQAVYFFRWGGDLNWVSSRKSIHRDERAALAKSNLAAIAQKELSKAIVTRKRKSSTTKGPKPKRKKVVKVEPSSIEAAAVAQNNSVADNTVIKTEPPDNAIELSSEQAKKWAQSMMMGGFSG